MTQSGFEAVLPLTALSSSLSKGPGAKAFWFVRRAVGTICRFDEFCVLPGQQPPHDTGPSLAHMSAACAAMSCAPPLFYARASSSTVSRAKFCAGR